MKVMWWYSQSCNIHYPFRWRIRHYINRGYYMAARRYEISLRVLKNISRVSAANEWNIFNTRLLYKHKWNTKPFHWNSFFPAKGAIYYVAIATVIFSWRYHVYAQKLTWYFIGGVYIKITLMHQTRKWKLYLPVDGGVTEDTETRKWINR